MDNLKKELSVEQLEERCEMSSFLATDKCVINIGRKTCPVYC